MRPAAVFEQVVRASARRPWRVLAVLGVLCLGAVALASGLRPSAATSTLAGSGSDAYQATERYRERFGDHAIVVLVRGPLEQLVLTDNLGRLLGLEGCLSGNAPADAAPAGGRAGPCAELARDKPVQVVYGPGTFINSAVGEIQDRLQARLDEKAADAEKAAAAARGLAERQGKPQAEQDRLADAAEQLVYAELVRDLLQLNLKYGLGVDETPRLDDPDFVSKLVFDPARGATTPKARFAYLFPSSESAAIQVRLKPGLDDAERERATALVREAVAMPQFALHDAGGYTVTGVPVLAEDLADTLAGSVARLVVVALLVMALVLALVFRRPARLVPLVVAVAAVALTFGLMALAGAPLTMASIAVLPVLLGLGVDYAIQYQARILERRRPARRRRGGRGARGRPGDRPRRAGHGRGLPRPAALARADGAGLRAAARGRRRHRVRVRAHGRDGAAGRARAPPRGRRRAAAPGGPRRGRARRAASRAARRAGWDGRAGACWARRSPGPGACSRSRSPPRRSAGWWTRRPRSAPTCRSSCRRTSPRSATSRRCRPRPASPARSTSWSRPATSPTPRC